jgi:Na+-driven multidrug efflux pump
MSELVSRFAGANEPEKVDRTVYQAFLAAIGISLFVVAPVGYFGAPACWSSYTRRRGCRPRHSPSSQ